MNHKEPNGYRTMLQANPKEADAYRARARNFSICNIMSIQLNSTK
jgi:hypothetical protein